MDFFFYQCCSFVMNPCLFGLLGDVKFSFIVKPDEFELKLGLNQLFIKLCSHVATGWRQTQTIEICAALFILIPLQR